MKYSVEKPGSPSELVHHGVKGQKWGVRKEEDTGGSRFRTSYEKRQTKAADRERRVATGKASVADKVKTHGKTGIGEVIETGSYKKAAGVRAEKRDVRVAASQAAKNESIKEWSKAVANAHKKPTPEESAAAMAENEKKFAAKFDPSGEKKGLTSTQKKLLIGAGAVGAVGGLYLLNRKVGSTLAKGLENVEGRPGEPIGHFAFQTKVFESKAASWGATDAGYFHTSTMAREGFELPVGHTFHRISRAAEDKFEHATYSTHSIEDFNRYMSGFADLEIGSSQIHHVTWQATKPIRVPSTVDALDTLHGVLRGHLGTDVTQEEVIHHYQRMSGGSWNSDISKKFVQALRDKGYHAVVDEMDAGVIGETPLVFFGTDAVGSKTSNLITKAERKNSINSIIEMAHRKTEETAPKLAGTGFGDVIAPTWTPNVAELAGKT